MKNEYDDLYRAYKELYKDCIENLDGFDEEKRWGNYIGMKGENYADRSVRLLLVGRACNGWGSFPKEALHSPGAFATEAVDEFKNAARWGWIVETSHGLMNYDRKYYLNRSKFWGYSKEIYKKLTGEDVGGIWMKKAAWTNLYKISPENGGNPTERQKRVQRMACRDILIQEIKLLGPTHILFMTDMGGWFDAFKDLFCGVKTADGQYVKAEGHYGSARICVSVRPERQKKDMFVSAVTESLNRG